MESEADVSFFNIKPSNSSHIPSDNNGNETEIPIVKFKPQDLYYDMSGEKFLIIFNHFAYDKTPFFGKDRPKERKGTHKDVTSLRKTFDLFNFKVTTHTDLTFKEIYDEVKNLSEQDHSRTSCLIIAILTHGGSDGRLYARDEIYKLSKLTDQLKTNIHLLTKPKLFFVQACRGKELDAGYTVRTDGEATNAMTLPSHIDFLLMRSSVEDYISWREEDGSWLIQELCDNIRQYQKEMDILQIITLTTRNVAFKRISRTLKERTNYKKQTPETVFTLTKFLKFETQN